MYLINNNNFEIKKAKLEDLEEISNLAKKIYLKYNSSLDTDEGVNNILKGKGDTNNVLSGLIGGKKGGASSILGNKKLFLL